MTASSRTLVRVASPANSIRVERGDVDSLSTGRVALIAQYSAGAVQSRSLSEYAFALNRAGFSTVIISTTEGDTPLEFPHGLPDDTVVLRRKNIGYDFGSWANALDFLPHVRNTQAVLLTNDSLLGPFAPIDDLLQWACTPGPDISSLTRSFQIRPHHQSYFLCFHGGILNDRPWRRFFGNIRTEADKESIVMRYEIELSRFAFQEAYSMEAYVKDHQIEPHGTNPTTEAWRALLAAGVPFIKRTLLTHPSLSDQIPLVQAAVSSQYRTNINLW